MPAFKGIESTKWQGFDNNKQNINRNGRPRKGISLVNFELAKKWYSPATKDDIDTIYLSMIHLSEEELVAVGKDKTKPMLARILAKSLLDKRGFENAEKMLDRAIGRPNQSVSWPNGEPLQPTQTIFVGAASPFTSAASGTTASSVKEVVETIPETKSAKVQKKTTKKPVKKPTQSKKTTKVSPATVDAPEVKK